MRNFILRNEDDSERGIFTGNQPRQAALKVANRGIGTKDAPVTIKLRERGTKKVHVFLAWRVFVDAPAKRPGWLPAKIYKPFVKKERIETLA
ncbi:MAG: non-histone chromosomal MC1 family protein [Saccharofermentanales bacterium]